jgi:hypothetical protein
MPQIRFAFCLFIFFPAKEIQKKLNKKKMAHSMRWVCFRPTQRHHSMFGLKDQNACRDACIIIFSAAALLA